MEPPSPEAPTDPLLCRTPDKATRESIFGAIAAGKELSRKIVQGIQEDIGFSNTTPPTPKPCSSFSTSVKLVSGQPNEVLSINTQGQGVDGFCAVPAQPTDSNNLGKHFWKVLSFFKSRHELGTLFASTANETLEDGFIIMSDGALRASIVRQGLFIAFSTILILAFCIMAVLIPSAQLASTSGHAIEGSQHTHVGSYWAMQLYGLLATCLCLPVLAWLGEWKRSWDCDCCHDEVQKTEGRAQEAEQKALQAHGAKQQFMAYVFHNIRVPFNAIVLGLGYLRSKAVRNLSTDISEKEDLIQMMLDCAETMTSVLDDVTDMGQWEDGAMELSVEEFDLLGLVKFLLWGLKDLLYQKQMRFSMSIDPVAKSVLNSNHVLGDKHKVLQTLGNFLSNAVKFSPLGGKLELTIKCEEVGQSDPSHPTSSDSLGPHRKQDASLCPCLRLEGLTKHFKDSSPNPSLLHASCGRGSFAKVLITVKDTGKGISPQDQKKLFEPYSFVSSGWVQMAGVSGLGLSIAKRFAERAGGYIGVESKEGEGSMFYFCLPYPLVPITHDLESKDEWLDAFMSEEPQHSQAHSTFKHREGLIIEQETRSAPSSPEIFEKRVLLVEDTEINRIILRKVLQTLQLSCEEAENGQVAVDLLKQGRTYDLILMDKEMPVMDGHEATRQIRLLGVSTPIVAVTGNALQSDRKLFLEAGVDDFQTKPLSRDKLVQVLIRFGVEIPSA